MSKLRWTPVEDGYPEDGENVQVTYLGYYNKKPYCDAFAYRSENKWRWGNDNDEVNVEITAWKHNCKPYERGD